MTKKLNLIGQKFGRLTVIASAPSKNGRTRWVCVCSCGNKYTTYTKSLRNGGAKSCGCLISDVLKKRNTTHGNAGTRIYQTWAGMKRRCYSPKEKQFNDYGGRGIRVCDEWLHDFKAFYDWAMSHGYRDDLTIDRIDVDGDYSPENCRFVDRKSQNRNRRSNHFLTFNDLTLCIAEWAERLGIANDTLKTRIQDGWSIERALTTPARRR